MSEDNTVCELRSWKNIFTLSKNVSKKIRKDDYNPDIIIGIARGGWVPARNLCDLLDITDLLSVKVDHWGKTATPTGNAKIKYGLNQDLTDKKILLVDDLTDTGESMKKTLKHIKDKKPKEIKTASLIHLSNSKYEPDYYGEYLNEWKWIIFPWNVTEDLERIIDEILEENKLNLKEIKERLANNYKIETEKIDFKFVLNELMNRNKIKKENEKYIKSN